MDSPSKRNKKKSTKFGKSKKEIKIENRLEVVPDSQALLPNPNSSKLFPISQSCIDSIPVSFEITDSVDSSSDEDEMLDYPKPLTRSTSTTDPIDVSVKKPGYSSLKLKDNENPFQLFR